MARSIYLLWLPIALVLVSSVQGEQSAAHLRARDELASEIAAVKAKFGNEEIDTTLEGYNHELVAREAASGGVFQAIKDLPRKANRILKPHHKVREDLQKRAESIDFGGQKVDTSLEGYDQALLQEYEDEHDDDEDDVDELSKRDVIEVERRQVASELKGVDTSLAGYDLKLLEEYEAEDEDEDDEGDSDEHELQRRQLVAETGGKVDTSLAGYDLKLLQEYEPTEDENLDDDEDDDNDDSGSVLKRALGLEESDEVDYSLEGYDEPDPEDYDHEPALEQRSDEEFPPGHGGPYEAKFDEAQYLTAWNSHIAARDFPDGGEEDLATPPASEIGPEDDEVDENDRYFDADDDSEGEIENDGSIVERSAEFDDDFEVEDDDEASGLFSKMKRWFQST